MRRNAQLECGIPSASLCLINTFADKSADLKRPMGILSENTLAPRKSERRFKSVGTALLFPSAPGSAALEISHPELSLLAHLASYHCVTSCTWKLNPASVSAAAN